jgi:hypothetical protein
MIFFKRRKQTQQIPQGKYTRDNLKGLKESQYIEIILQMQARIEALEEQVAKLSKNSRTSSKPPSSDITNPPKSESGKRKKKKRTQGAQEGHEGASRTPFTQADIDAHVPLTMQRCPDCHGSVTPHPEMNPLKQQVVELPEKPIIITEYIRTAYVCTVCQQLHYAPLPAGVIEGQLLGPKLQGVVGYMKGALHCSYSNLQDFFAEILRIPLSRGLLCQTIARVSHALEIPYEELKKHIPNETIVHTDESGWKDKGRRFWAWVFANRLISFFTIEKSRASKVLRKILGKVFSGTLVSDFYSAYVKYANHMQQFCLAHLIRDIKFLITLPNPLEKRFGKKLLFQFKCMFRLWHARDTIPKNQFAAQRDRILKRIHRILDRTVLPPETARLAKRFEKHWDALFRFLFHDGLEPTNNLAERAIRALILDRKVTQGSRSVWGRQWNARIWTVLSTCRKQHRSAWDFIQQSINAFHFQSSYPSLIPVYA